MNPHFLHSYLIMLTWFLVGPPRPIFLTAGLLLSSIAAVLVFKHSFRARTFALLGIFGIMLVESVQPVLVWLGLELVPVHVGWWSTFRLFVDANLLLTLIGTVAACCAAVYIQFGRVRMDLATAFPQMSFVAPTLGLRESVTRLAGIAGVMAPEAVLVDSGAPTAFTVKTNGRYAIAVTIGLLESLESDEVEACIAHEIAHLKNNDFALRLAATLSKVALFARPLSYFIEPAVYRAREFLADKTAAQFMGGPDALASALSKLQECSVIPESLAPADAICLCQLTCSKRTSLRIFDKHPDLEKRISMLRQLKME